MTSGVSVSRPTQCKEIIEIYIYFLLVSTGRSAVAEKARHAPVQSLVSGYRISSNISPGFNLHIGPIVLILIFYLLRAYRTTHLVLPPEPGSEPVSAANACRRHLRSANWRQLSRDTLCTSGLWMTSYLPLGPVDAVAATRCSVMCSLTPLLVSAAVLS